MKIGIIGAGDVGSTLGNRWIRKGNQIVFGVRNINSSKVQNMLKSLGSDIKVGTIREAASFGDVVVLCVPWEAAKETIENAGDLSEKILVDLTNPISKDLKSLVVEPSTSAAEEIARWCKGSKVVKAFNAIGAKTMNDLQFDSYRADTFICGDDFKAKSVVTKLAKEVGFDVVDVGPLINARLLEQLALLWIELVIRQKMGPNIAFKLLKRRGGM